ncbi:hypothetical protein [Alcaligenes nematophilus]|uniref:hypothetical protein n=1 Tax=Alcaligenes nematophilus TaxID=2994643 RepID=UPI00384FC9A9
MSDKPENFVVTFKGKEALVERHFVLPNGSEISYKQVINNFANPGTLSMNELQQISADKTIRYLLQYLPEGYDTEYPYKAGSKI